MAVIIPDIENWLLFIATVLLASAFPAPVMLPAMSNGIRHGVRKTAIGIVGSSLGMFSLMLLSALGLSAIMYSSEIVFTVIKWLGAGYLVYLGLHLWLSKPQSRLEKESQCTTYDTEYNKSTFIRFYLVTISNPKGMVFFGALFPQFIDPAEPQLMQFTVLCISFLLIDICRQFSYATVGSRIIRCLEGPANLRLFNRLTGCALITTGIVTATLRRN